MSDDSPVDVIGPWTIKSVATETRRAVTKAAQQDGVTVGQWLERRVSEWLANGSPVPVQHAAAPASVEQLCRVAEAAARVAEATGKPMPAPLRQALNRGLGEVARANAPPPRSRLPKQLPPPPSDTQQLQ
jgi:hypothetical protein